MKAARAKASDWPLHLQRFEHGWEPYRKRGGG